MSTCAAIKETILLSHLRERVVCHIVFPLPVTLRQSFDLTCFLARMRTHSHCSLHGDILLNDKGRNFGRGENTSFSRPCQSCGHFQQRRSEQWAPPCVFSVIAAHFLTLFVLENLSVFPSAKKWNKTQPTTGQTSYTFGMSFLIGGSN